MKALHPLSSSLVARATSPAPRALKHEDRSVVISGQHARSSYIARTEGIETRATAVQPVEPSSRSSYIARTEGIETSSPRTRAQKSSSCSSYIARTEGIETRRRDAKPIDRSGSSYIARTEGIETGDTGMPDTALDAARATSPAPRALKQGAGVPARESRAGSSYIARTEGIETSSSSASARRLSALELHRPHRGH